MSFCNERPNQQKFHLGDHNVIFESSATTKEEGSRVAFAYILVT